MGCIGAPSMIDYCCRLNDGPVKFSNVAARTRWGACPAFLLETDKGSTFEVLPRVTQTSLFALPWVVTSIIPQQSFNVNTIAQQG